MDQPAVQPANLAFTMSIISRNAWVTRAETLCLFRRISMLLALETGGADRDRTDDLMLAKHALSQLSYGPSFKEQPGSVRWWARDELNVRPHAYQACALTT